MSETSDIASEALRLLVGAHAFDTLPREELDRLAGHAKETRVSPGAIIVREGDVGDRMFLIASGSVQVLGRAFDESELVLARLEPGQYFGEQALLSAGMLRRNASVRAVTNCRLLVLTRDDLLAALDENSEFVRRLREAGEKQRELRKSRLREQVLRNLGVSESYRIESFKAGDWIFRQGDQGERVYLIVAGSANVIRGQDGKDSVLAELLPGQFFGELAILNAAPRAASVCAVTDLEVASLDGGWFRSAVSNNAQLRQIMSSLESMYMLPRRGMLTLQTGKLGAQSTLTAIYHLTDGRRVISTRLVDAAAFTARVVGAGEATQSARYTEGDNVREIHLSDGKIVEIEGEGGWPALGEVLALLLDGSELSDAQLAAFEAYGDFREGELSVRKERGLVCQCSNVTAEQIVQVIEDGGHTLQQVAAKTKATLVCGGCTPSVRELLGQADWTPARCERSVALTEEIRSFLIRPLNGTYRANLAGQHLVLQARIDGNWIQRPYTISSSGTSAGIYEVTVKREPQGTFSCWLFDRLQPNSLLRISGPNGNYYATAEPSGDIVCLVGGIGVTPALAMARTLSASLNSFRLHVDYSVSHSDQIIYREELESLAQRSSNFRVNFRITASDGRINEDHVKRLVHEYPNATFYLCAGGQYMEAVSRHLTEAGVPSERIQIETFTVAGEHC